jgi:hypothetical protein
VLQYQIVQRPSALDVRIVVRRSAGRELAATVRERLEEALHDAGAAFPVEVEVVDAIAREEGPAAKVKLVRSEL